MNTEKVAKGLNCCTNWEGIKDCGDCPYLHSPSKCITEVMKDALKVIDEQQAEIERLKKDVKGAPHCRSTCKPTEERKCHGKCHECNHAEVKTESEGEG